MTTDHSQYQDLEEQPSDVGRVHAGPPTPQTEGIARLLTAGAMTAVLSGDVRLAVRATRLLINEGKPDAQGSSVSTLPPGPPSRLS